MLRIAIIGGGIGGLTAAIALRRFGFEPEVYEQAPELLEVGAAIAIWPNAVRVLDALNLKADIIERAGQIDEIRWLESDGSLIKAVPLPRGKTPAVALHRADLQSTLVAALPQASLHLGCVFKAYRHTERAISAVFVDGLSIETDLLIGADGLHSQLRSQVIGDSTPHDCRYVVWRGIAEHTPTELPGQTAIELHGSGRRFGIGSVGHGRIGWWATASSLDAKDLLDDDRVLLTRLFSGWYRPVLELIESTEDHSMVRNEAFDRYAHRPWGNGRVTLLGDAAHPTTPNLGQGGCLAIEDAAVLARTLNKHLYLSRTNSLTNISVALRAYERDRYARTALIADYSRRYGIVGQWSNGVAVWLRRIAFANAPEWLLVRLLRIIFEYDAT